MIHANIITLIAETTSQNENGYIVTEETKTDVYAAVKSVKRTEFYEALRSGITATVVFEMFAHDYDDQRLIEYNDVRYQVERTYKTSLDQIELTCSEVRRQ